MDVNVVGCTIVKTFLNVFCRFQEVGCVTFLKRVFDVQCQAGFAAWQLERCRTNYLAVTGVNSDLAVDRVADVGGAEAGM